MLNCFNCSGKEIPKSKHLHCFLELAPCFLEYQKIQWGSFQGTCHCSSCPGHTVYPGNGVILNKLDIRKYMNEPITQILIHLTDI